MGRWVVASALLLASLAAAHAQPVRLLPANGKLGELVGSQQPFPLIQIGSQVLRLAPGGLIYDQNNRTILHNSLPDRAGILYVQGPGDEIMRIYILRPEELEILRRKSGR